MIGFSLRHGFGKSRLFSVLVFLAAGGLQMAPSSASAKPDVKAAPSLGFLSEPLDIKAWLPPEPAPGSVEEMKDKVVFLDTRALIATPRGAEAAADDVYAPSDVAPRFAQALGYTLNPTDTPRVLDLIEKVVRDAENLVSPVKQSAPPTGTGRVRPFVAYPREEHCPLTPSDVAHGLATSGSYPSTHAMVGWIWTTVLSHLAPDRVNQLIMRGLAFGESRVVCGFHYPSDIQAGRLAVAALIALEEAEPKFQVAIVAAKREFDRARQSRAKRSASISNEQIRGSGNTTLQ